MLTSNNLGLKSRGTLQWLLRKAGSVVNIYQLS